MELKQCTHASGVFSYSGGTCDYCTSLEASVQLETRLRDEIASLRTEVASQQVQLRVAGSLAFLNARRTHIPTTLEQVQACWK